MSYLYVCEQGANIGYEGCRFQVRYKNEMVKSVPAETLESIQIFGKIQLTTQCMEECLKRGINVVFYSSNGAYFGRLISTNHVNVARQRKQAALSSDFKLTIAKNIILSKIKNQVVILRRYSRYQETKCNNEIMRMLQASLKVGNCDTLEEIMGYEGAAA